MRCKRHVFLAAFAVIGLAGLALPCTLGAQQVWRATVGAQNKDMSEQVIAFLPNELWIHAGDSITWTSASGDIHTISFLIAGQPLTDFTVGCPGFSPSGASFDGSTCVTAPPLAAGQSFSVKFPSAGNYKLICLVHTHMSGVIHVLAASATLPHDQKFYDDQAASQQKNLLKDAGEGNDAMAHMLSARVIPGKNRVAAGLGEMSTTGAGFQSVSLVRFLGANVEIHVGDTVEWNNLDPAMPHTITFGTPPDNPGPPSANVSVDADGALHATINFVGENVHSGILVPPPQNQPDVPVSGPGGTVFRVTFTNPGTYDYVCVLHDDLGMQGQVIVLP